MASLPESLNLDSSKLFIYATVWILFVATITTLVWNKLRADWSFLHKPRKYQIALYLVPIVLVVKDLTMPSIFGVNSSLYVVAIVVSVMWQDVLTFGFLQTYLEKKTTPVIVMFLVAASFWVGHIVFQLHSINLFVFLLYALAFLLLSFLRFKTKNIYLTNILHLTFLLLFV